MATLEKFAQLEDRIIREEEDERRRGIAMERRTEETCSKRNLPLFFLTFSSCDYYSFWIRDSTFPFKK